MFLDHQNVILWCCCAKSYFISQQKLEHRLGYVNSFHVLSQMAVSSVGSLEQQQNVESRLAFEDLGLEPHISWPIELLFHADVKECSGVQPFLHLTFFLCNTYF